MLFVRADAERNFFCLQRREQLRNSRVGLDVAQTVGDVSFVVACERLRNKFFVVDDFGGQTAQQKFSCAVADKAFDLVESQLREIVVRKRVVHAVVQIGKRVGKRAVHVENRRPINFHDTASMSSSRAKNFSSRDNSAESVTRRAE